MTLRFESVVALPRNLILISNELIFFFVFRLTSQGPQFHTIYDPNTVDWHLRPDHTSPNPPIHQYFPNRPEPVGYNGGPPKTQHPNLGHYAHYVPTAATTNADRGQMPAGYPGAQGWACPKLILRGLLPGLFWNPMELCSLTILNLLA